MAFRIDHLILGNRKFDLCGIYVNIQYLEKRLCTRNYLDIIRNIVLGMDEKNV